jgi:hypothetical protein
MDGLEMVRRYRLIESERDAATASASAVDDARFGTGALDDLDSSAPAARDAESEEVAMPPVPPVPTAIRRAAGEVEPPPPRVAPSARERRRRRLRAMPIIGISANAHLVAQPLAAEAGMDAFVSKPCTLADLKGAVAALLSKSL